MKKKILSLLPLLVVCFCNGVLAESYQLVSPNGKIKTTIETSQGLSYSVYVDNSLLFEQNKIALCLQDNELWDGANQKPKAKESYTNQTITSPLYRTESFEDEYTQLDIKFKEFGVIFRCYDQGVAYRLYTLNKKMIFIENEVAKFNINDDRLCHVAYSTNTKDPYSISFQNTYTSCNFSDISSEKTTFLPSTICYDGELKVTILESDLESYPGMFLKKEGGALCSDFAPYPKSMTTTSTRAMSVVKEREDYIAKIEKSRSLPWRIMAITTKDIEMPTNNLVYALASPSRIEETSWIEGGLSTWDWWNDWGTTEVDFKVGINTQTYKHYIDFAAQNNLPFVVLDEGWYDPKSGDMLTVIDDIDMQELALYAKQHNVGLVLWGVVNVALEHGEELFAHYSNMGIKGFKLDFLNRDDQNAVEMIYEIAQLAAKHKLTLDFHGMYKPTGFNRTYPNIINTEAVFGMEEVKWIKDGTDMPLYDVMFPYIRMMCGFIDYTPGAMLNGSKRDFRTVYHNPMSMGTRAHQVAMYVIVDSPITMLCDATTRYLKNPATLEFISKIPQVGIKQTKILSGKLGEYIVSAREFESCWYVGGITSWQEREVELDLSFLESGEYKITLFKDGININKNASDHSVEIFNCTNTDKITIKMASGGGFAARIEKP